MKPKTQSEKCAYDVIPAKAGIQKFKDWDPKTGFRVKPGMTMKEDFIPMRKYL
jgi:hypothetical protein